MRPSFGLSHPSAGNNETELPTQRSGPHVKSTCAVAQDQKIVLRETMRRENSPNGVAVRRQEAREPGTRPGSRSDDAYFARMRFLIEPSFSTSHSQTSPSFRNTGGLREKPTPNG